MKFKNREKIIFKVAKQRTKKAKNVVSETIAISCKNERELTSDVDI